MAQIISNINQSKVLTQLDTYNHTALLASLYTVAIRLWEIPPSGISIVIKQNGSTIVSSVAPAAAQEEINLRTLLQCAVNDTITVVISSATVSDSLPNSFKAILDIQPGLQV
jgi:hypothetical protein